jgi:Site-specific recombinase XerD
MGVYKKGECWYIDYYFEGRRKREKIGPNKKLAETVLKKRKVEIAEGKFLDRKKTPKIRFFEMARQYLGRPDIKNKKSYQRDKLSISKLEKAFGDKLITEITPSMIEEYRYKRLQEFSYRKHETKPATVNRELACLKHLFSKAIQDGKLDKNPVRFVKMEKENNERDRALSLEEFIRLMKFSPEYLKPVLLTAYYTGMRRGEILNLKWDRVDLKTGSYASDRKIPKQA